MLEVTFDLPPGYLRQVGINLLVAVVFASSIKR